MTFEEAVKLAEEINLHIFWEAEIDTDGEVDGGVYLYVVSARFERYGLVYNTEIEAVHQWPHHFQRMDAWVKQKENHLHGN